MYLNAQCQRDTLSGPRGECQLGGDLHGKGETRIVTMGDTYETVAARRHLDEWVVMMSKIHSLAATTVCAMTISNVEWKQ